METYKPEHYYVLLAQMLRSPAIAELASSHLEPHYINDKKVNGRPFQAIFFSFMQNYYREFKSCIDGATFLAEVHSFADMFYGNKPIAHSKLTGEAEKFLTIAKHAAENGEPFARKLVQYIADQCVIRPQLTTLLSEVGETSNIRELGQNILDLDQQQQALQGGKIVNSLLDLDIGTAGGRVNTHIPWLDARFGDGDGPVLGCVMAIIAPQGCGKTSLGIQLAVSQALSGNHALLVLAEEGLTLSMMAKIFGCALGIPYPLIRGAAPLKFSDKVKRAIEESGLNKELAHEKLKQLNEHLHVLNLVENWTGLSGIQATLQELYSEGKNATYTYVDWAGIIANRIMAETGNTKESELKNISYTLNEYTQQFNSIIAVSQQMAATCVEKGPFSLNDHYCAADCRGFTEPMKYVFVINPQDSKTKNSLFIVAKARDDEMRDNLIVKLDGQYPVFRDVSHQFEQQRKAFIRKHDNPTTQLPKE